MSRLPRLTAALLANALLLLASAGGVVAAEYRAADQVTIGPEETIEDDLYVAAGTTTVDGTIEGDLTVASGTVDVRGTVTGSVNVSGGNVNVTGSVGGAVRSLGGNATISGDVERDVVVAGGNVVVQEGATVGGDVAGAAGSLNVSGTVEGDILAAAGELTVNGTVGGSIDGNVGQLTINSDAVVDGDVLYASEREAQIAEGAEIGGTVERREPEWAGYEPLLPDNPIVVLLGAFLGLLVLGWGLMLVRPGWVAHPGARLATRPLLSLGAGLATWIGQFLLVILLAILGGIAAMLASSFGGAFAIPAVIVVLAIIALVFLSHVYVAMGIGDAIARRGMAVGPWVAYAIGALVWAVLLALVGWLLPALGALVFLLGWIVGLGAVALDTIERRRPDRAVVGETR